MMVEAVNAVKYEIELQLSRGLESGKCCEEREG
jgi:hypothetical protein